MPGFRDEGMDIRAAASARATIRIRTRVLGCSVHLVLFRMQISLAEDSEA